MVVASLISLLAVLGTAGPAWADPGNGSSVDHSNGQANANGQDKKADTPGTSEQTTTQGNPNQACDQTPYGPDGNGANTSGPYDDTCDGSPSGNGNGGGNATGKPCAGCVGNADEKNPPGQQPGPQDHNNGYECDGNNGIAKTNPAHTGCGPGGNSTDACPNMPGDQPPGTNCNPSTDACPNMPGNQPAGTNCNPSTDACPNMPGNQPAGTDCNPGGTTVTQTCPGGGPFTDTNGNGTMDADECGEVAGETVTNPPAGTTVLGVQLVRSPATPAAPAVLAGALPRTGGEIVGTVDFALLLMAAGIALVAIQALATRRRSVRTAA
jgi:hypothetical protein